MCMRLYCRVGDLLERTGLSALLLLQGGFGRVVCWFRPFVIFWLQIAGAVFGTEQGCAVL
jgi:hypothetical protein